MKIKLTLTEELKYAIILFLLGMLLIFIMIIFGIGWECLLEGTNCPPPTNVTGLV